MAMICGIGETCCFRAGLRLLEEENNVLSLKKAIQEGIDSGIAEDFEPSAHLQQVKASRTDG